MINSLLRRSVHWWMNWCKHYWVLFVCSIKTWHMRHTRHTHATRHREHHCVGIDLWKLWERKPCMLYRCKHYSTWSHKTNEPQGGKEELGYHTQNICHKAISLAFVHCFIVVNPIEKTVQRVHRLTIMGCCRSWIIIRGAGSGSACTRVHLWQCLRFPLHLMAWMWGQIVSSIDGCQDNRFLFLSHHQISHHYNLINIK